MNYYLGIDVGSVSTNLVLIDEKESIVEAMYLRTKGKPVETLRTGLKDILEKTEKGSIKGVGTTGSARQLTGALVGADVIKNEITAHAVASLHFVPDVRTIIEIGGQDSKIIILRDGIPVDFAMNTVCAAGTGSFLDQQAGRLDIPIEQFGEIALKAENIVKIAGRCTVFAESDMIHKQQMGYEQAGILMGLCEAMVRNYLNNVGRGKTIEEPIIFQGGVAANSGIKAAFEKELKAKLIIPEYFNVMGAFGSAKLGKNEAIKKGYTNFKGSTIVEEKVIHSSFECHECPNFCEVFELKMKNEVVAIWGDRCEKWQNKKAA
jgi:predicted CoA-substrate-specific enzyme activase